MTVIAHRCAVLGKPIAHSLSPVLHNAAYKALGLDDWAYERHEVGESDLDGFLKGLDPTWCGLSLTMPLKKTIQPYGTPSNMWAQRLKVANTAIFDWPAEPGITPGATPDGTSATGSLPAIRLYNTDVMGIVLAFDHELKALGEPDRWKSATSAAVIGNGNTAASAVAACTVMLKNGQTNKRITVAARHPGKNRQLPDIIGEGDATITATCTIAGRHPAGRGHRHQHDSRPRRRRGRRSHRERRLLPAAWHPARRGLRPPPQRIDPRMEGQGRAGDRRRGDAAVAGHPAGHPHDRRGHGRQLPDGCAGTRDATCP